MTRRHEVMEALNGVVAEHDAARRALGFLLAAAGRDPSLLGSEDPTFADLRLCLRNLERTYLVRLFALFEENLREVWTLSLERPTEPLAKDLLDGCASRQAIRDDGLLRETHQVREYRNYIVHGRPPAPVVQRAVAKSRLCRFLGWMPETW